MFIIFFGNGEAPREPFRDFQELPDLVRDALAWGTKQQIAGIGCGEREVTQYMVDRYGANQTRAIGELIWDMLLFIQSSMRCRMVRCYVDNHCDMVAAKLAWREDY